MTEPEEAAQLSDAELLNAVPPAPPSRKRALSTPALIAAVFALVLSWFTPWVLPVAVIAVVLASIALARRHPPREQAAWALGLGLAAIVCCTIWALWILAQLGEVVPLSDVP